MSTFDPTPTQQAILDVIFSANYKKPNIIISGPGGAGKTTLLKMICQRCKDKGYEYGLTALTGIAAYNLGGETIHRFSGIGIGRGDPMSLVKKVSKNYEIKLKLRRLKILIIDEVSMLGLELFEKLHTVFAYIRDKPHEPFGGVQLIFCGDFLQLPPVDDRWFFNSEIYDKMNFQVYVMEEPLRYTDKKYFELLMRVRDGTPTEEDHKFLYDRVRAYKEEVKGKDLEIKPTIFYSCNRDVDSVNESELEKLPGEEISFSAKDVFDSKIPSSRLKHYASVCENMIPEILSFKIGAQVMLKANLDPQGGLCNGSRGVVLDIHKDVETVRVKFVNGIDTWISRFVWEYEDSDGKVSRSQIPLVLAWSMTIHKCVAGNSMIMCRDKMVKIEDLFEDCWEQKSWHSYQGTLQAMTLNGYRLIKRLYKGEVEQVVQFTTQSGYKLTCSLNHQLLMKSSKDMSVGWEEAQYIKPNDFLHIKYNETNKSKSFDIDSFLKGCFFMNNNFCKPVDSEKIETHLKRLGIEYSKEGEYIYLKNKIECSIENVMSFIDEDLDSFIMGLESSHYTNKIIRTQDISLLRKLQLVFLQRGYRSNISDCGTYGLTYHKVNDKFEIIDLIVSKTILSKPVQTYDLEIDQVHNFVANGIVCHNSQSCTLDYAVGDLGYSVFAPGQAYVMLSRIRNSKGLYLMSYIPRSIKVDQEALEFVKKFRKPKKNVTNTLTYNGMEMEFVDDDFMDDIDIKE